MNIGICGLGRAGKELARVILDEKRSEYTLTCAFCRTGSSKAGIDIGEYIHMKPAGIQIKEIDNVDAILAEGKTDVIIDFSSHVASLQLMISCYKYGVGLVVCTTGFDKEELNFMWNIAEEKKFGLVYAPNVTLGVNVLISLAQSAAKRVPEYDYTVLERHHSKKTDPISATALKIKDYIYNALPAKHKKEIPVGAVRAGGYIGYHEVLIVGETERISIIHESFSRKSFAEGALRAAKFLEGKKGLYDMQAVLKDEGNIEQNTHKKLHRKQQL